MKKKLLAIAILGFMLFPFHTNAQEVSMNLEETLKDAGITYDLSNYKESDDQTTIYLFRGSTCGYCHKFLEFLNSIVPEYGKYFKLKSYEVWGNADNSKLMKKMANFLDETANGVPFIIIGDQAFTGYASTYDEQIKKAITDQYNSKNSYDIVKEMEKAEKANNKSSVGSVAVIIWNLVFVAAGTGVVLLYMENKNKALTSQLEEVKKLLTKANSTKNTEEKKETKKKTKK